MESKKQCLLSVAGKIFRTEKLKITRKNKPVPCVEPAFCISDCKFGAGIALKSPAMPLKSIFMAKHEFTVREIKSHVGEFRAIFGYFVFPRVKCLFFAHLHQNKPKSLFCPIQERRKLGERGKNGTKVRFSRIFCR